MCIRVNNCSNIVLLQKPETCLLTVSKCVRSALSHKSVWEVSYTTEGLGYATIQANTLSPSYLHLYLHTHKINVSFNGLVCVCPLGFVSHSHKHRIPSWLRLQLQHQPTYTFNSRYGFRSQLQTVSNFSLSLSTADEWLLMGKLSPFYCSGSGGTTTFDFLPYHVHFGHHDHRVEHIP